jgi:hypothetical protein
VLSISWELNVATVSKIFLLVGYTYLKQKFTCNIFEDFTGDTRIIQAKRIAAYAGHRTPRLVLGGLHNIKRTLIGD